jgi:hypothetical protein
MSALDTQVGGDHYKNMKIQPADFIHANGLGFLEGSAIQYIARWRNKNGVIDLQKAKHCIDLLIDLELKYNPPKSASKADTIDVVVRKEAPEQPAARNQPVVAIQVEPPTPEELADRNNYLLRDHGL